MLINEGIIEITILNQVKQTNLREDYFWIEAANIGKLLTRRTMKKSELI